MKEYIRIKTKHLFILLLVVVLSIIAISIHIWCSYHPEIQILISEGPTERDDIQIEAPHIAYSNKGFAKPNESIVLKVNDMTMQHEVLCDYVEDNYKTADIQLEIKTENDQMILSYVGTATNMDGEVVPFEKNIICDYVLDANIQYK